MSDTDHLAMTMHLALCGPCRESIDLLENAAGAFMDDLGPESPPQSGTLDRMMTTLSEDASSPQSGRLSAGSDDAITRALALTGTDPAWTPVQRGVSQIVIPGAPTGMSSVLIRLDKGEMMTDGCRPQGVSLVLVGELVGRKRRFKRGDVFHGREGIRASSKGAVVYLHGTRPG